MALKMRIDETSGKEKPTISSTFAEKHDDYIRVSQARRDGAAIRTTTKLYSKAEYEKMRAQRRALQENLGLKKPETSAPANKGQNAGLG